MNEPHRYPRLAFVAHRLRRWTIDLAVDLYQRCQSHSLLMEDKPNLVTGAPGVLYSCSCGWSQGWVEASEGDLASCFIAVKRINRAAHKAGRRRAPR